MIVRPRPNGFRMLFVLRGSVLPRVAPQIVAVTLFALVVTELHGRVLGWKIPMSFVPFSLIGLTLAIFLGFRNSTAYARFWEARTFWGMVMVECRSLLRLALAYTRDAPAQRALALRLMAFAHALRHQLRGSDGAADLARLLGPEAAARLRGARFVPALLLAGVSEWIAARQRAGEIDAVLVPAFEVPAGQLSLALGGCERISNTPIPFPYVVMIHRTVVLYCLLLPFGLLDAIGIMTPVVVALVAYTFFALEAIGAEIEEPFGLAPNDLALHAITGTIEASLREMLGETPAPPEPVPPSFVVN